MHSSNTYISQGSSQAMSCVSGQFNIVRMMSTLIGTSKSTESQKGDSFDLAHAVTSLLLGAGYTAAVAAGWAPRHIACQELQNVPAPDEDVLDQFRRDAEEYAQARRDL